MQRKKRKEKYKTNNYNTEKKNTHAQTSSCKKHNRPKQNTQQPASNINSRKASLARRNQNSTEFV